MESIHNLKQQLSENLSLDKKVLILSKLTANLLKDAPTEAEGYADNLLKIARQNNLTKEQAFSGWFLQILLTRFWVKVSAIFFTLICSTVEK